MSTLAEENKLSQPRSWRSPRPALADEMKSVAFVPEIVGIPYFNAMQDGGNKAAKDLGVKFIYSGPVDTNPVDQLQIVQNLINQGVNAIAVSVLDASSIAPVVQAAKAKGSILFTSDSDAPNSGRAVFVAQATDEGLGDTIIDEMVKRVGDNARSASSRARRRVQSQCLDRRHAEASEGEISELILLPRNSPAGRPSAPPSSRPI